LVVVLAEVTSPESPEGVPLQTPVRNLLVLDLKLFGVDCFLLIRVDKELGDLGLASLVNPVLAALLLHVIQLFIYKLVVF
jgi:hypothetical protein